MVTVEPLDRPECQWCAFEHKRRLATHAVKVVHNFRWVGAVSWMNACKHHAQEIKDEFERQIAK